MAKPKNPKNPKEPKVKAPAKPKEYVCKWCVIKSPEEEMVLHIHTASSGTQSKWRYHKEKCYDAFLIDQKFKKTEKSEMDELHDTIMKLHKLDMVPNTFYRDYIQPFREGVYKRGKRIEKRKGGVTYGNMRDAYLYIRNSIDWSLNNKTFKDSISMLKYTFAIMVDSLADAVKNAKKQAFVKEIAEVYSEANKSQEEIRFAEREITFKNKSNGGVDISDLLD